VREAGTAFLRLRPWVVAPAAALTAGVLARAEVPGAQRGALWAGVAVMTGLFTLEAVALRRRVAGEAWLFRSLGLTLLGLGGACAASGALQSPLLPLLFAPTVTAFAAFGRRRGSGLLLGGLVAVLGALALLPPGTPFPPLPQPEERLLRGLFSTVSVLLLALGVANLSESLQRTGAQLERSREDVLAAAAARAQSLEAVGARVAHELKNPLAAVKGLVDLMADEPRPPAEARRFAVLRGEVDRLEGLVRDSLAFARPLDLLRPSEVELGQLARDTAAVLEARAAAAGVPLTVEGPPLRLRADPHRLREALLNLLGNALEASAAGAPRPVRLSWARAAEGTVRIAVEDGGEGMDAATLARLGTPFFTTRAEGTGLGVALARAVAAQHGGSLRYESAPGRGTLALLELPLAPPEATPERPG
jgi:signal transduction histidine kinase